MSNSQGWISLHRSLQDHPLWKGEPFTKGQAWVDLLLYANHKPARLMIKNTLIDLDRGQQARSQLTLSKEWKWSINKVKRFLKVLESDQMLTIQTNQQTTIISICNYSSFQDSPTASESTSEEPNEKQTRNKRITNNNVNKNNNENKIPYQLIADAYQKYYSDPTGNGGLVAVKQWSAKRKGAIKKLWLLDTDNELENNQTNNIEHWERYFDYCSSIAFFQGDASRNDDHANWKASFDFLIKVDTYNANKERKYS
jgi:hypothetical protein